MPVTRDEIFRQVNSVIDGARSEALRLAALFSSDAPRDEVVRLYNRQIKSIGILTTAAGAPGMVSYAALEWGPNAPEFIAKAQAIQAAMQAIVNYIAANFPTFGRVLDAAMTALNVPAGQQDALRTQLGSNLNFILVEEATGNGTVPVTIPAAQLTVLVGLLNNLASAATIAT